MPVGRQRGDDEARIGAAFQRGQIDVADHEGFPGLCLAPRLCRALTLGGGRDHPLGLADHPTLAAPALVRSVLEVLEPAGWLAAPAVLFGRLGEFGCDTGDQPAVLGQAEQIIDVVLLTPCHQLIAREAGIRPQHDPYFGPTRADLRNDSRHLVDRARAGIDIGPAQLGAKQMPPAKNIQRQVTVGFVIAVKEAPFLLAMQRIVGGIEIERDLAGRRAMRLDEQIDEQPVHRLRVVADLVVPRRLRFRQFQPVQRRLARHRGAVRASRFELSRKHRHQWVVAQRLMVVEVLVAERDGEYPLPHQRRHRMFDVRLRSSIDKAGRQPIHQPDRPIRCTQQQPARVRSDRTAVKPRDHFAAFNRFKSKTIRDTLCGHRGSLRIRRKSFSQNNFR